MEQTTILCYGDSNTYGYDPHTDGERYPLEACWTTPFGPGAGGGVPGHRGGPQWPYHRL